MSLTSTTAPGKIFASRTELAAHYKSDWHKYNLKRREAGLPLLCEPDFEARWQAALALRREQQAVKHGTDHLKNKKKKKKTKENKSGGVNIKSQAAAYDKIKEETQQRKENNEDEVERAQEETPALQEETASEAASATSPEEAQGESGTSEKEGEDDVVKVDKEDAEKEDEEEEVSKEEEEPVIEPRQCLFDKHICATVRDNVDRMQRKYGFFVPDQEYLVDLEGLVGYCHEKIKLGHLCLYCERTFVDWQDCQRHMISKRHTKLRYERNYDMEELSVFYDFTHADNAFLGRKMEEENKVDEGEDGVEVEGPGDMVEEWEDVSDDENGNDAIEENEEEDYEDEEDLYAGYKEEIAKFGFDVTPLGELVFPDGRIVGHRALSRYYKQRPIMHQSGTAVVAARQAAGERLYRGRVYNMNSASNSRELLQATQQTTSLALMRAGVAPGTVTGRAGKGILVSTSAGGFSSLSLYRYRAAMKKQHRQAAQGQRLQNRTRYNLNRMDKKANRLSNNVCVAKAPR